jgi:Flp pilus assembly protein TadG
MKKNNIRKSEKGQSFVEMAVSFSILLIILAGLLDIGTLFFSSMSLRDAAQEGVNYAMYNPLDRAGIESRVRNASNAPLDLTDPSLVSVNIIEAADPCLGTPVTVQVTYHFEAAMPFFGTFFGSQNVPLLAEAKGTVVSLKCAP